MGAQGMAGQRVVIVDDHPLFRNALKQALVSAFPAMKIDEAASLDQVNALLEQDSDYDLVCLDLKMPGVQGFSGLVYLRAQFPAVPVVVVSGSEEPPIVRRALDLGASGFIPKSTPGDALRRAFEMILAGDIYAPPLGTPQPQDKEVDDLAKRLATLTPQQVRVLMMLREGLLNKQIAFQLGVSEATIKAHVSAILQKLNVDSRTQAVIAASKIDGESASEISA
jgi:DNA-binding NarL/FixJ family response regulator